MVWTIDDVETHARAGLTTKQKTKWLAAANKALAEGKDEATAIETATRSLGTRPPGGTTVSRRVTNKGPAASDANAEGDNEDDENDDDEEGDEDDENDKNMKRTAEALELETREATMIATASSYNSKTRECEANISTGARVRRRDYDGDFDEVLDMSAGSIRLDRLNRGAQLIDGHRYFEGMRAVIGAVVPGSARVDRGNLTARFKLSRSELGQRVAQDLMDGITVPLSVGYRTHREVRDETTNPPTRVAVDWEPFEVSVAVVPHEAGAAIRSAQGDGNLRVRAPELERTTQMANDTSGGTTTIAPTEEELKARDAATEVRARDYAFEMIEIATQAGLELGDAQRSIKEGVTVDEFRKRALTALAAKSKATQVSGASSAGVGGTSGSGSGVVVVRDELEGRNDAMAEAMMIRILSARRQPGVTSEFQRSYLAAQGLTDQVARSMQVYDGHAQPTNDRARQYLGMGWIEIAAECLGYRGHIKTPAHAADLIARAFQTTSDYPAIFLNALNKSLLARYQLQIPTYKQLAQQRNFNDFRPHPMIRTGEFPMPEPLTETGEIKAGHSIDSKETVSVQPYGIMFNVSRQSIVNDEMGAIDQILGSSGDSVLLFENKVFFTMFLANPTLATDSKQVFDTAHGNISGSGHEPGIAAFGIGRAALRQMKTLSGNPMNVTASIVLAGPAHETRLDQMTSAGFNPVYAGAQNPFSGKLTPVIDAYISGNEWYFFALPGSVPCFVYGFLNGQTGPRLRTDEPFGVQGIRISLEHDFGVGAIDYRGVYKDTGAAPTDIVALVKTTT